MHMHVLNFFMYILIDMIRECPLSMTVLQYISYPNYLYFHWQLPLGNYWIGKQSLAIKGEIYSLVTVCSNINTNSSLLLLTCAPNSLALCYIW